jgi:hypothetical protein
LRLTLAEARISSSDFTIQFLNRDAADRFMMELIAVTGLTMGQINEKVRLGSEAHSRLVPAEKERLGAVD